MWKPLIVKFLFRTDLSINNGIVFFFAVQWENLFTSIISVDFGLDNDKAHDFFWYWYNKNKCGVYVKETKTLSGCKFQPKAIHLSLMNN